MKKIVTIALVFVLALSLGGIVAFAEKPIEARCFYGGNGSGFCNFQNVNCPVANGCPSNFCGNYGTSASMSGYVSERPVATQTPSYSGGGQGYQGSQTTATTTTQWTGGQGSGYVDNNGDGYCDNWSSGGQGSGYVDNNGDGYCDNWSSGGGYGGGYGGHHGGGHHGGGHHR